MTMVDTAVVTSSPARRTGTVLAAVTVPQAVVVAVVAGVPGGVVVALVGFVVVLAASAAVVWTRAAGVAARDLGGRPADPVADARVLNLVDGLCVSAGVRPPALRIVDSPGLNLATAGREAAAATLVVTSGLVGGLTRMELEGVLAAGIVGIRRGDTRPATVAAVTGIAVARALPAARDRVVDEAAAALTRYPPGLVAAYRKLDTSGTVVPGVARRTAHLWLADPGTAAPAPYRTDLSQRIDALQDL